MPRSSGQTAAAVSPMPILMADLCGVIAGSGDDPF